MWFISVEIEQETSAPPPKKNPGSSPDDIGENTKVQMGLFADDAVFYFGVIKDCNDAESLQQDLNTLVH